MGEIYVENRGGGVGPPRVKGLQGRAPISIVCSHLSESCEIEATVSH
jgi:hypothetical protein